MLKIISSKAEIAYCQTELFSRLDKMKSGKKQFYLGTRGGGGFYLVSYSSELGIWWYKGVANNKKRYWNAFGVGSSPETLTQDYFIEINYPMQGTNRRVAALWAKDEWGKIFLMHSGKMGGGKKGFTKEFFFQHYNGTYESVNFLNKKNEYVLIGGLYDTLLPYQVAQYVKEVFRIKNINISSTELVSSFEKESIIFSEEFSGKKTPYSLQMEVAPNCNHGLIVNELAKILNSMNLAYGNDKRKDLFIVKSNNSHTHLFEIKSAISLQNIYTAIGQLFLNSQRLKIKPHLIFVCPEEIPSELVTDLKSLNIITITFSWEKGIPKFKNLNRAIKV